MKKWRIIIGLVLLLIIFYHSAAWSAGSCVFTRKTQIYLGGGIEHVTVILTCTGDGSITAFTFTPTVYGVNGYFIYNVTTDPGSSAPTDLYDITLVQNSEDLAGGLLADRSTSSTQTVNLGSSSIGYPVLDDSFALTFANNTANPSTIVIYFRFRSN